MSGIKSRETIVQRAMDDPEFLKRLLEDPTAAVQKEFNVEFPAGCKIEVHSDGADKAHFVLPIEEPGDEEIDEVTGGMVYEEWFLLHDFDYGHED